jgi:hypothetical protein
VGFSEKCTDTARGNNFPSDAAIEADEQDLLASANKFMKAFESHPDVKRLPSGVYLLHRVHIKLAVNNGEVEIVSLNAIHRSGGFGGWCLDEICSLADRTNTKLSLTPTQFDSGPMDTSALRAWYTRHDFKCDGTERMLRLPKEKHESSN